MARPGREFSAGQQARIRADRAAGSTFRELEQKYKTSRKTLVGLGLVKDVGRRKRGTVEEVNAALQAAEKPDVGRYLVTLRDDQKEFWSLAEALAECVASQASGGGDLRLWRELKFKVTAVIEEK